MGNTGTSAGAVVVITALIILAAMTAFLVQEVNTNDAKVAISTTALGVLTAIVGAFFGVKAAAESSARAQDDTSRTNKQLNAVLAATEKGDPDVERAMNSVS